MEEVNTNNPSQDAQPKKRGRGRPPKPRENVPVQQVQEIVDAAVEKALKESKTSDDKKIVIQPMMPGILDSKSDWIRFSIPIAVALVTLAICVGKG